MSKNLTIVCNIEESPSEKCYSNDYSRQLSYSCIPVAYEPVNREIHPSWNDIGVPLEHT